MAGGDFARDAGGNFVKILWKDGLSKNLNNGAEKVHRAAVATTHRMAPQVESYMKNNAPWTDRTGNARNGLAARAYEAGDEVGIVLYHQVSYGIWLEVRFSGKYAIIQPTIDEMGPQVMSEFDNLLERI